MPLPILHTFNGNQKFEEGEFIWVGHSDGKPNFALVARKRGCRSLTTHSCGSSLFCVSEIVRLQTSRSSTLPQLSKRSSSWTPRSRLCMLMAAYAVKSMASAHAPSSLSLCYPFRVVSLDSRNSFGIFMANLHTRFPFKTLSTTCASTGWSNMTSQGSFSKPALQ